MVAIDWARLERGRESAAKARGAADRHLYFRGVAEARYILRRVFRLVEEEARRAGIDPLAHQALIQIYGSTRQKLRIKDVAERLDITPAFASALLKPLIEKGYVLRQQDRSDRRTAWVKLSPPGRAALHRIDQAVQAHVDYFSRGLKQSDVEAALSILLFYAGVSLKKKPRPARLAKA